MPARNSAMPAANEGLDMGAGDQKKQTMLDMIDQGI